jgi:hypothetical protein
MVTTARNDAGELVDGCADDEAAGNST